MCVHKYMYIYFTHIYIYVFIHVHHLYIYTHEIHLYLRVCAVSNMCTYRYRHRLSSGGRRKGPSRAARAAAAKNWRSERRLGAMEAKLLKLHKNQKEVDIEI